MDKILNTKIQENWIPAQVYANDLNPESYKYLQENIPLYVESCVEHKRIGNCEQAIDAEESHDPEGERIGGWQSNKWIDVMTVWARLKEW